MSDEQQFPPYPKVIDLPDGLTEQERYEFAFRLLTEQGDEIGDYLFAAVRQSPDSETMMRWAGMVDLVQKLHGKPITLSYRACERIAAEGGDPSPIGTAH